MQVLIPGFLAPNLSSEDLSPVESGDIALRTFLYKYCGDSANPKLSRGFLSGLEVMIKRLGSNSDLVKACQAVAFVSSAKPLSKPDLSNRAELLYQELLGSLAKSIESPDSARAEESRVIVMLLGLYQIIMTSDTNLGNHDAHAKGLAALMKMGHFPPTLFNTAWHTSSSSSGNIFYHVSEAP
jgi:hypothetical protein